MYCPGKGLELLTAWPDKAVCHEYKFYDCETFLSQSPQHFQNQLRDQMTTHVWQRLNLSHHALHFWCVRLFPFFNFYQSSQNRSMDNLYKWFCRRHSSVSKERSIFPLCLIPVAHQQSFLKSNLLKYSGFLQAGRCNPIRICFRCSLNIKKAVELKSTGGV